MLPTPASQQEDSNGHETSELETIRQTLKALEKSIEDKRIALGTHAAEAERLNREWEKMLRKHRKIQQELQATGSMTSLVLEGLSFDLDVLKHAFRKWIFRIDHKF